MSRMQQSRRNIGSGIWAAGRIAVGTPRGAAGVAQGQARTGAIAGALHRAHRPAVQGRGRSPARQLDAQGRQQQRTLHSVPLLEQIEALALQHLPGVLPGSLLGKALHYLTAQWPKLVRYVNVFVDDDDVRFMDGLSTAVPEGGTLSIMQAVAGG